MMGIRGMVSVLKGSETLRAMFPENFEFLSELICRFLSDFIEFLSEFIPFAFFPSPWYN